MRAPIDHESGGLKFIAAIRVNEIHGQAGISLETLAQIRAGLDLAQKLIDRAFSKPMQRGCEATETEVGGSVTQLRPPVLSTNRTPSACHVLAALSAVL